MKATMNHVFAAGMLAAVVTCAHADRVKVEVHGIVEWNQVTSGVLGPVRSGDAVVLKFEVDSNLFVNSPQWPVRGYPIVQSTWNFQIGSVQIPLLSPMPTNVTPYFSIRNNDPGVDGFVITTVVDGDHEIPVNCGLPNYGMSFLRTFSSPNIWPSYDIMQCQGDYAFEFMSSYNWTIQRGEFSTPVGMTYETISVHAVCVADFNGDNVMDFFDYLDFVDAFSLNMSSADFNQDLVVDFFDYLDFVDVYSTGC